MLEEWLETNKKYESIRVLAFIWEIKTLSDKKIVSFYYQFSKNRVKIDIVELLVYCGI